MTKKIIPLVTLVLLITLAPARTPRLERASAEAVRVLRHELEHAEKWVKVHAAEALLRAGRPEGVEKVFLEELSRHGDEPQYRIGIWRVLCRAADSPAGKAQWLNRITAVFFNPESPDRLHAIETMGKLQYSLDKDELQAVEKYAEEQQCVFAYWVLAINGRENAAARLAAFSELDNDLKRRRAAFCLSQLNPPTRETWLAGGGKAALQKQLKSDNPADRRQACRTLAALGVPNEYRLIVPLLGDEDADTRVYAAGAILQLQQRRGAK